ncbi:hypothetical protein [Bradyrhizobium sp. dw_411]|uniref:hypothetical protein n=1 Tax=Bradyrhizobium sp. dw_411 TaxID=2720082 RepID=UPI0031FF10ED
MIAAIVVPFGCRNIPSTVSCLDGAGGFLAEVELWVGGLVTVAAFDLAVLRFFAGLFLVVEVLRMDFARPDLSLVGI